MVAGGGEEWEKKEGGIERSKWSVPKQGQAELGPFCEQAGSAPVPLALAVTACGEPLPGPAHLCRRSGAHHPLSSPEKLAAV